LDLLLAGRSGVMGETVETVEAAAADDVLCPPSVRPMTREEFERAGRLGLFGPEERLELIGGEVVRKMSPQDTPHASAISFTLEALQAVFRSGAYIRVQLPLALGPHNEPEPDLAVVKGSPRDYETEHPTTALLLVEIADSTLRLDRGRKAALYARAGIAEYWIVNLVDRVLEVHREPAAMADQPLGHHYRSITRHPESASVSPLAATDCTITITDLMPRPRPQGA
jgi:Uma2 family endonuclease